jgi:putative ABC transport system permease protein
MFKINLKFALRHLFKNKSYSILNILGLAFGMSCSLVILLWIFNEYDYDNFHQKNDQLFQVFRYEKRTDGSSEISPTLSAPLATALLEEVPEIKAVTRVPWFPRVLIKVKDKSFFEQGIIVDTSFFEMFSFKLKQGDPKQVLHDPGSIVISEKLVEKYFGTEDPIGKTIIMKEYGNKSFLVSGIVEDVPKNSSFQFDFAIPFQYRLNQQPWLKESWGNLVLSIYIETSPNASQEIVSKKIKDMFHKHHSYGNAELFVQQFSKIHLYPAEYKDQKTEGLIILLRLMFIIALAILIIACINFANLSTALSSKRSREIGIKKVLGSIRSRLVWQFLTESLIISFISMLLTITCTELLLPKFNVLFSKSLHLTYSDPKIVATVLFVWLFTAFLSGIYPAFAISSFKPIAVLKSNTPSGIKGAWFKKTLVVFQFTIAITLIIITLSVNRQIQFIRDKDLGLEKENILSFEYYDGISKHSNTFKNELLAQPGVKQVSFCSMNPLTVDQSTSDIVWEGKKPDDNRWFFVISTDFDFIKTFDVKMKEGRELSSSFSTDSTNFIINEKAAKAMGFKSAIDQRLSMWGKSGKIVGVVKDFHIGHLSMPIMPLIINIEPQNTHMVFVKLLKGNRSEILKNISKVYRTYEPDYPFDFIFQTDFFEGIYKNNLFLIGSLSSIFSILAIIISCLGLYGLTSFSAEQRTKEIGIRKVNGAPLPEILKLLLSEFLKWVIIAYLIALPLGILITNRMLKVFAFHYPTNYWIHFTAGVLAILIAIITVSWQAWRAASRNPIEALRYE